MSIIRLAVDLAKDVFQVYGVDGGRQRVVEKKLTSREKFVDFVAKSAPCEIIMEACGSSNHWARKFTGMGCIVKLIAPQYVKSFVHGNKNDLRDARAIMEASFSPSTPYVTPKTVEQQDIQSLLRIRSNYLDSRTAIGNQVRGLLKEYGIFINVGYSNLQKALPEIIARDNENGLTSLMKELIEGQYTMLLIIEEKLACFELQIKTLSKQDKTCLRLQKIEGIGPISALAVIALVGDGKGFRNGRHFAAYLGLVPKEHSSGNRQCTLGISKRGNGYLRELFIHGGRSVVKTCTKKTDPRSMWVNRIKDKGGKGAGNKAAVAFANKNARIVMAMLLSGDEYRKAA
jgi:transposase